MKSSSLLVFACLLSAPTFAQSLPDEINYAPHESQFRNFSEQVARAESQLSGTRSDLQEAVRFISEMTAHIAALEDHIRQSESQISANQRAIPQLQSEISYLRGEQSRLQSEIRRLQSEEQSLQSRHQQEVRNLRPLENAVAQKEQRIHQLQSELSQHQRIEREAASRLSQAQSRVNTLNRQIEAERSSQRQMQIELRSIEGKISQHQSSISQAEANITSTNSTLATERRKLSALDNRIQEAEKEIARLRASGAPAEEIAKAERTLRATKGTRESTANQIRQLESQISKYQQEINTHRARINDLRREQQALPSRIASSEAKERQLVQQRQQAGTEVTRYQSELTQAQRNVQVREQTIVAVRQDLRQDEANLMRQRQLVENLVRQIASVRGEINSASSRSHSLDTQVSQLNRNIQELQTQIPQLQAVIRQSQNEITQGQRDLVQARNDERNFNQSIASQEVKLSQLIGERNNAEAQMNQRLSLYNRYLSEAHNLGSSQSAPAEGIGEQEGQKISEKLSRQNGLAIGKELGLAEARYWGFVRGEVQGHEAGYAEGIASSEDISRGEADGVSQGKQDAHLYAQANFKPMFFEELVLEEFRRPLQNASALKSFKSLKRAEVFDEFRSETIPPVSAAEIERSLMLKTSLDELITNMSKDVKAVENKARRMADGHITFEQPAKVPYGVANCSQVYKNLAVFKAACDSSYKDSFASLFMSSARNSYLSSYSVRYERELNSAQIANREASYAKAISEASQVSRAQGLKEGKAEIYKVTFSRAHKTGYDTELPLAREKSRVDAAFELKNFLTVKPLLTLGERRLVADEFRGGEEVVLAARVKNVSQVPLNGPAIIRITSVENAELMVKEAVLNHAAALSVTEMPALKLKILGSAKAGQKVVVKGMVELPGDLYRPQRQESFELVEILAANPAHTLGLSFDRTPKIKSVFNRYIHKLTASVKPSVEDIAKGYRLTLTAKGENAGLVELKETSLDTGALKQGQARDLNFSYTFLDAAKNKSISLELAVHYGNKVIKKENIELIPR